jgi:queuine tRNA-ribosyltransferase/7-cyano-7-deazaguanine tRNA-ribosyltransferase
MIEFKVLKKSKKSQARLGVLKTKHGDIETPSLVPVATQAVVKTLGSDEVLDTKSQILIANTFHLHLKPGEGIIKANGGIHKFMNWPRPLMTDSGGFQVFSLGFGKDFGTGKINKSPEIRIQKSETKKRTITTKSKPQNLKITDKGVWFRSPIDGRKIFMGPSESIKIQEVIGADIIFAFDECTSPLADKKYIEKSMARTHKWAKASIKAKKNKKQSLFGIVQGSHFKDLRQESAKFINSLNFDGFGIGGDLGDATSNKQMTKNILRWTLPYLDAKKPRHLLGIGFLEDIEKTIKEGIDLFDCTVPTQHARHGIAYTSGGKLDLYKTKFLRDRNPLDKKCDCKVCQEYNRSYLSHLIKAREITGLKLLTFHNLYFFNSFVEEMRKKIKKGKF